MATINELSDATSHINQYGGNPHAWREGLSYTDQRRITDLLNSPKSAWDSPGTVKDTLIGALRNQHPTLFNDTGGLVSPPQGTPPAGTPPPAAPPPADAPPAPGPQATPDGSTPDQEGAGIDAVKTLEEALKGQNSKAAAADRQLVEAVMDATSNTDAGKRKLAALQQSIEDAVERQTTLDTPMGASEFQKFLLTKQKEIIDVIEQADLDDKSKREILAGLSALYDAPGSPEDTKGNQDGGDNADSSASGEGNAAGTDQSSTTTGGAAPAAAGPDAAGLGDPLADLLSDPSLTDPALLGGTDSPLGALGSQMPQMPSIPSIPGLGGGGMPGLFGGGAPASSGLADLLKPKGDDPAEDPASISSLLNDPALAGDYPGPNDPGDPGADKPGSLLDQPDEPNDEDKPGEKTDNEAPTPGAPVPGPLAPPAPPGSGPTEVHLPNGETVTAPNPQLANVSKAVAAGTPIGDAFRQNGMTVPPPGAAVPNPVDPSRITMGAIGQFSDHQVYALSKDLVYMNGQIHPIADAAGPGFLGWIPAPEVPTAPLAPPAATVSSPAPATPMPSPSVAPAAAAAPAPTPASGNNLLTPLPR